MTVATAVDVNIETAPDRIAELMLTLFALFTDKIELCFNFRFFHLLPPDDSHYRLEPASAVDAQLN
jgi:hypothetical protein